MYTHVKAGMASFLTACQSGGLRAGRRAARLAGACGLRCAPCGSPGADCCCNSFALADSRHPDHPRPPDRPYPGDKQPNLPDEHCRVFQTQKPASLMVSAALGPAGKSPLVFAPEGAKKSTKKPTSRPYLSWR